MRIVHQKNCNLSMITPKIDRLERVESNFGVTSMVSRMSYERKELEKLYNESVTMGRLRTGDPMAHMVDGALKIIRHQEKLAEYHYRATVLAENYDSVKGSFDLEGIAEMVIGEENDERGN